MAVTPADAGREVADRAIGVDVGERDDGARKRGSLGSHYRNRGRTERTVGNTDGAINAGRAAPHIVDGHADGVAALLSIGVRAHDKEAAWTAGDHRPRGGMAVAPGDARREVAGGAKPISVREGSDGATVGHSLGHG